jgi:uncharacterized membrane protein
MKWAIGLGCLGGVIVAIIAFFVSFYYFGQNAYEFGHLQIVLIISLVVAVLAGFIAGLIGFGVAEVVTWWLLRKKEAEKDSS